MTSLTTGTLDVPGATLHYEQRGSGPVLLLIPGGAADAGLYEAMAPALATGRFTVVSYDPRGLSRSPLDGPLTDQRVEVWSDDAHRLLDLLAPGEDAYVFGSSSGAIVALDLLARHPERLRRVVAHEPPLLELLDDPAPHRALFTEVRDISRERGAGAAIARFSEGLGERPAEKATELPPELRDMAPRMHANLPLFLERILCPFSATVPDVDALSRTADRLVLAAGRDSRQQEALYGPVKRLAELLGAGITELPGGHVGCTEQPEEFARLLLTTLGR
ncbi:alpha/beta fold hydrolase [Streptomyces sp. NPDC013953]|uniref:alpha/beta fold hydrolase n=1 Tax=Streptomyces sp. NPDC013953 TaxID=3364868 RepID=UPI0036F7D654